MVEYVKTTNKATEVDTALGKVIPGVEMQHYLPKEVDQAREWLKQA